jgi:hypothetical protein
MKMWKTRIGLGKEIGVNRINGKHIRIWATISINVENQTGYVPSEMRIRHETRKIS